MTTYGKIAVGRINYIAGKAVYPSKDGYKRIVIMMKSHSKYWPLSPYYLKTDNGTILENAWQFRKAYPKVPFSRQSYSRYDPTIVWQHDAEVHLHNGVPTKEYYAWRAKGMANPYPVRYPVGYKHRHECVFSLTDDGRALNYANARKEIYLAEYANAARKEPQYTELMNMVKSGKNILICEVDGPHQESNAYYNNKYGTSMDLITDHCVDVNGFGILGMFLSDTKHSFGHGFALAWTMLEDLDV